MKQNIEIGKVSARGQIAIPLEMRRAINLNDGEKVLFMLENDIIIIQKISEKSLQALLEPLHNVKKKIKESQVSDLIHKLRN